MITINGGDLVQKVAISGPTLASILYELVNGSADVDGLVFGRVTHRTVMNLQDDNEPSHPRQECTAHVTGFCCPGRPMSFYNAVGQVDLGKLHAIMLGRQGTSDPPIGWFIIRRNSPLRPSMRESVVSASLSAVKEDSPGAIPAYTPCLFCLFTSFTCDVKAIHTYDYRVYQYFNVLDDHSARMTPRPVSIVNIGPAFRAQYDSFAPVSSIPLLLPGEDLPNSPSSQDSPLKGHQSQQGQAHQSQQGQGHSSLSNQAANSGRLDGSRGTWASTDSRKNEDEGAQVILDRVAQGYSVNSLRLLTELSCKGHVAEMEALYNRMLAKLEDVAQQVGSTNALLMQKLEIIERLKAG